jgi:hypothetical protein
MGPPPGGRGLNSACRGSKFKVSPSYGTRGIGFGYPHSERPYGHEFSSLHQL